MRTSINLSCGIGIIISVVALMAMGSISIEFDFLESFLDTF